MTELEIYYENFKRNKKKLVKSGPKLAKKYSLELMVIFGSYATGKARVNSDLDIGVMGHLDFSSLIELTDELSTLLGLKIVEVVNLKKASPLLAHNALRTAVVVFEHTPGILSAVRLATLHRFVETKSLREIRFNRTKRYIKEYLSIK